MYNSTKLESAIKLIDSWLSIYVPHNELPSISIGIIQEDKLVFAKSYGYTNLEGEILASPTTNYRLGSLSKSFTAVSILQLAEKGQLKLDDKVQQYLSWFVSDVDENLSEITIRQLLSHTAGLRREGDGFMWDNLVFPTNDELMKIIEGSIVCYEPLSTFKYSNLGFAILGRVVEAVSGITYGKYIKANIFDVLGMNNSSVDEGLHDSSLAQGYDRKLMGYQRKIVDYYDTHSLNSVAGVISNVEDFAKYVSALMIGSGELLTDSSKLEMQRVQFERSGETQGYGLGVIIDSAVNDFELVTHYGSMPGFEADFAFDNEKKVGVVVLTNAMETPISAITDESLKVIQKMEKSFIPSDEDVSKYSGVLSSLWTACFVPVEGNVVYFEPFSSTLSNFRILEPVPGSPNTFKNREVEGYWMPGERIVFEFSGESVEYVDFGGYKMIPHEEFLVSLISE